MRILIVTDQYAPMVGGVPTVTRALATGLADRGHAVAVMAPSPDRRGSTGTDGRARLRYLGSLPWPLYDGMRLASPVGGLRTLTATSPPDVVHIHCPLVLGAGALLRARQLAIPVVYTNHYLPANVNPALRGRPRVFDDSFYSYVRAFSNRCTYVTAPSATALQLLRGCGLRAPSRVISNGVDARTYSPGRADEQLRDRYRLRRDGPLILSVGRLSPEKRVDVLIDAAARLTRPAQLAIAGAGPQEAELRARANRLGLARQVTFLGFVPDADLPGLYRLADIFAIASEAELQSLATLDAMATGLPVVAAGACALTELVQHGSSGFLFRPGRAAELAAYLDMLAGDPDLRCDMTAAALRAAGAHDRQCTLAEWERLYQFLVSAEHGGRQQ
jgi:glycosyltransferase involved in cell wall biosynthesis